MLTMLRNSLRQPRILVAGALAFGLAAFILFIPDKALGWIAAVILFGVEIAVLVPLLRQRQQPPTASGFLMLILFITVVSGTTLLLAVVHPLFGTWQYRSLWEAIAPSLLYGLLIGVWLLMASVFAEVIAKPGFRLAIRAGMGSALHTLLGERPGAYAMIPLWIALISVVYKSILASLLISGVELAIPSYWLLSLALAAAAVHWSLTQPTTRIRRLMVIAVGIVLALVVILVPINLPNLIELTIVFGLVAHRRNFLSGLWRAIIVGMLGGVALVLILRDPLTSWTYNTFVPQLGSSTASGNPIVAVALAIVISLAIGPIVALWIPPTSRKDRLILGALAGTLAGMVLFGELIGALAGIAGASPLYGVALTRVGFGNEWILKLGIAVVGAFQTSFVAFWLPTLSGALIGAVSAAFTPIRPTQQTTARPAMPNWSLLALFSTIILSGLFTTSTVILSLLGSSVRNIYQNFGYAATWSPESVLLSSCGVLWIALIAAQVISLWWLYRQDDHEGRLQLASLACFSAMVSILCTLALLSVNNTLVKVGTLIMLALSIELFAAGWRLRTAKPRIASLNASKIFIPAGLTAGLLMGAFAQVIFSPILSLAMIDVYAIVDLAQVTNPPPGVAWLQHMLSPVPVAQTAIFHSLLIVYALLGLVIGAAMTRWPWQATLYVGRRLLTILLPVYRRITPPTSSFARRWLTWTLIALVSDILLHTFFPVFTALVIALAFTRPWALERLRWPVLAVTFVITLIWFIQLWTGFMIMTSEATLYLLLLFIPAAAVSYSALMLYTPQGKRSQLRLTALICVALISGVFSFLKQDTVTTKGGVSRFADNRWQAFNFENSLLGRGVNYHFYQDSDGLMWFGSNRGTVIKHANDQWELFLVDPLVPDSTGTERGENILLTGDRQGRVWVALNSAFGRLEPHAPSNASLELPKWQWYEPASTWPRDDQNCCSDEAQYTSLDIQTSITAMSTDRDGNLWLGTAGNGLTRIAANLPSNNALWGTVTAKTGQLTSDNVQGLYVDATGKIWVATDNGVSRYDGAQWTTISTPTKNITALFVDSRGGLWMGTASGAQRFDGQQWASSVTDQWVTTFAEGPAGVIWIGTQKGLIRYELDSAKQELFNSENSGLAADWVRELHVDPQGGLWVSTYTADRIVHSPLIAVGLSILLFGYLFTLTYRSYQRAPETRARQLNQQIKAEPAQLYPSVYALLADNPMSAYATLMRLARRLAETGDPTGAASITALAALANHITAGVSIEAALDRTLLAFGADTRHNGATALRDLHSLLIAVVSARNVTDIVSLELAVNPGEMAGSLALSARNRAIVTLPTFLPEGSGAVWRALERIGVTLRKYQDVDDASDRLSYLAEALNATETAGKASQSIGPPEGHIMAKAVGHWQVIVTSEINRVSGRADLRLELRTRQIRWAEKVTLALRLQNTGRAVAENILIRLQDSDSFTPIGENIIRLEYLSSGRSVPIEFGVCPTPQSSDEVRIVCVVSWQDRTANDNRVQYADLVRFYEFSNAFQRIPNPYIVGHPVKADAMFYGRDDVFRFIEDNLSGSVQARTIVLYGQRRTGKTSILYRLLNGRLGNEYLPVLIDMQELALLINHTGDFLSEIAYQIVRALHTAKITIDAPEIDANSPTRLFNRFLDTLVGPLNGKRLVMMIDEFELIEAKITEGKLDADILGYFRSLIQHRDHLVFIFTGTHRLEEMSRDYWSILFNLALYRRISYLSQAEAAALIRKPVKGSLDVDDLVVEKIVALTNGHPYLIQLICWALVNQCNAQQRNYATINDVNDAVQEILTTGEVHFAYLWQQASGDEQLVLAAVAHTVRPGKLWAHSAEILETLTAYSKTSEVPAQQTIVAILDGLVAQEILGSASEGLLRYRFQIEVLRLWIADNKSIAAIVERRR